MDRKLFADLKESLNEATEHASGKPRSFDKKRECARGNELKVML